MSLTDSQKMKLILRIYRDQCIDCGKKEGEEGRYGATTAISDDGMCSSCWVNGDN